MTALTDRISAIVTAESGADGTLNLVLRAVDGAKGFHLSRVTLTLALWRVDAEIVRMSVEYPTTGTIAYLQGTDAAIAFARALGLEVIN